MKTRRLVRAVAPALFLVLSAVVASGAESSIPALVGRLAGDTPLAADLEELTDGIGGRPTGTPAFEAATSWAVDRFRAAGVDDVGIESYSGGKLWIPRGEAATLFEDGSGRPLRVAQMPFSAAVPAGGLQAPVVDVGSGDEAGFGKDRVRGALVLVHTEPMKSLEDLFMEYLGMPEILDRAKAGGAAGVLWMSNRPSGLLYRHNLALDGSRSALPAALVDREAALRISRRLARGKSVKVLLTMNGEYRPFADVQNVVAEIRGVGKSEEVVMLGAHLDSWDLGDGALDDGANVALVLDVARQAASLAKSGHRPQRTLRFVLYGGEESGLWGSLLEVRSNRRLLDSIRAQVILDIGTGRITGFSLGGREDAKAAADAALRSVAAFGPFEQTADAFIGTDNYDYLVEGVPTFVANQDGPPYLPDYHAASDTFDKVDLGSLRKNAVIAGAFLWGLADAVELPKRQSRAEVEELVKRTQLDAQMKPFGLLAAFESGERGREKPPAREKPRRKK